MMDDMSNVYLTVYILFWLIVFIIYQKRRRYFGTASVIILSYLIYAICSYIMYNDEYLGIGRERLHLFPFVYLGAMLLVAIAPAMKFKEETISIRPPNLLILDVFSYIFIFCSIIRIPDIIDNIQQGIVLLLMDPSGGESLYYATHDKIIANVGGGISNIFAIIYNLFIDVAILFYFYYLTLSKRKRVIIVGYTILIICSLLDPLSQGLRTGVLMKTFNIIIAFFLMKPLLGSKVKQIVKVVGTVVFSFVIILFISLTISRFGDRNIGTQGSMLSYIGQANINFNTSILDAGGTREANRTCNLFKQMLGYSDIPRNVVETRVRYSNLKIDDSVFSTFVGDFVLDFGPVVAPIIFILFSLFIRNKTKATKSGVIQFHQVILIYFSMIICMQGGMYLFDYSYGNNLVILAFVFIYFVFKFDRIYSIK
ncbi:MAG: oligosaccharide repeat unit polymerase [Rikenellaceae bacterium]|nr:oligosaccharide repeat unit polymerase [Rikenellaceae bacterium]